MSDNKEPVEKVSNTVQMAGEYLELLRIMYTTPIGGTIPISFPTSSGTKTITLKRTK